MLTNPETPSGPSAMLPLLWIVGATVGGAIGAAVWAAIAYFAHYEIGWIAWGVGGLCGAGLLIASRGQTAGALTGGIAAVIAVVAILTGKYAAVYFTFDQMVDEIVAQQIPAPDDVEDETLLWHLADEHVYQDLDAGQTIDWPDESMTVEVAEWPDDYPPRIQRRAQTTFSEMNDDEKDQLRADLAATMEANMRAYAESQRMSMVLEGFKASFGLFDILFFVLAIITAFKLGAGHSGGD